MDYVDSLFPQDILKGIARICIMPNYFSGFGNHGLHTIHVIVGIGIMLVLALLAGWSKFSGGNHHTSEIAGLSGWRR
jgi:heme/copper-type cytochrome/quinol oxidase subunit 3